MIVEKYVDYLQYSMNAKEEKFMSLSKPIAGMMNYKRGYLQPDGTRVLFGHSNTDKALFIKSGLVLHNRRVDGLQIADLLDNILCRGANVSRIDLCLTEYVDDGLNTPEIYANLVGDGKCVSSHAKHGARYIASIGENYKDDIETVYIGDMRNRAKRGIVRVYDKGVELDIGKYLISRVEVEDKRDKAQVSAKRIASGHSVGSVLKTRVDFDDMRWINLLDADDIDMSRGKQIKPTVDADMKNSNRWAWLVNKIAPTIAKAIAYDMDSGLDDTNLNRFNEAIELAYANLREREDQEKLQVQEALRKVQESVEQETDLTD